MGERKSAFLKQGSDYSCHLIHDNNYHADTHTLFGTSEMPMVTIFETLKEVGHKGPYALEVDNFIKNMPEELFPFPLKFMADTGR